VVSREAAAPAALIEVSAIPALTPWDIAACLILFVPFVWFGFGLAAKLPSHIALPLALLSFYPVFALPRGIFDWQALAGMGLISLAACALAKRQYDWAALALLGISVDLGFFKNAFPVAGLNSMPKLLFVDVGLYSYLVLRPLDGVGYDFRPRLADFRIGLREFALFTPIAIALGFALSFLHLHAIFAGPLWFAGAWLFTILFIAIPEELFFRGLMLNLMERRIGTRHATILSSVLFGLAHFNKRAAYFNWRYVILAAIAGFFYARAWRAKRRVLASSITHATVDTVWSIWLR
jgi:membrane protease YdiL (CAAX protease family)